MLSRLHGRLPAPLRHLPSIVVVGILISVVAAGSATASKLLTGGDIKNGSLAGADVRNGSLTGSDMKNGTIDTSSLAAGAVTRAKLAPGVLAALGRGAHGVKGETGVAGTRGPTGPDGDQGSPGQSLVSSQLTSSNSTYGGANVVDVPSVLASNAGPTALTGVELLPLVVLAQGSYLIHATSDFFDFNQDGDGLAYGVTRTYLDGQTVPGSGFTWTTDIPDNDPNNRAQNSGSHLVVVPAGGGSLSIRALVRGGSNTYQAGASVQITKLG